MRTPRLTTTRPGFTLVEVLVAAALCILIMTLMAYAFQQGMDTFSLMKSVGDMQERLRATEIVMRDDLSSDHLDSDYGPRVADQRMDLITLPSTGAAGWKPPRGGYFRVFHGSQIKKTGGGLTDPYQVEGVDSDQLQSTRATDHILQMTVRRKADRPERAFYASVRPTSAADWQAIAAASLDNLVQPPSSYPLSADVKMASDWAEVSYFLDTTVTPTPTTPGGVPMYPLYRRVRVLGSKPFPVSAVGSAADQNRLLGGLSVDANKAYVDGPTEVANPDNRLGGKNMNISRTSGNYPIAPNKYQGVATGDDILLTNVLSFEVRITWDGTPAPTVFSTGTNGHSDAPFDDVPAVPSGPMNGTNTTLAGQRVFDTWWDDGKDGWRTPGTNCVPQFLRVKAVQIKVRVYDTRNQTARQLMIVQNV